MNYLAAMLLLALGQEEEDAFWVLASLIDDNDEGKRQLGGLLVGTFEILCWRVKVGPAVGRL